MGVSDHFKNEKAEKLLEKLAAECEKFGLYLKGTHFTTPPELADHEDPPVFLQAVFLVGEKAFEAGATEVDPEKAEEEKMFADLAARFSDPVQDVRQEIQESLANGEGLGLDEDISDITDY